MAVVTMVAMAVGAVPAAAEADWQTVMRDRDGAREVQIDRASILRSDAGTRVAWARLVLGPGEAAAAGYDSVRTLNRYDCSNRSIVTVRRVYLDASHRVLREERVEAGEALGIRRNTVDERLWREVCATGSLDALQRAADRAGRAASQDGRGAQER